MYYVRSGNVYVRYGSLRGVGSHAYARSLTAEAQNAAYRFYIDDQDVTVAGVLYRYAGFSVRS